MKDGSKIAKKTFVCVAGVAVGLAAFAARHPELIASESERVKLPVWSGGGWTAGYCPSKIRACECSVSGAILPESVTVTDAAGRELRRGVDFQVEPVWGAVGLCGAATNRVNELMALTYSYRLQRIDSKIKRLDRVETRQGVPHTHLPKPPAIGDGERLLENVLVTADGEERFPVTDTKSRAPDAASQSATIPKTLAKLRNGRPVTILAWGDSVTEGAYLPPEDRWQEQFVRRLRKTFPRSEITLVSNGWGGRTTEAFLGEPDGSERNFTNTVLKVNADLVISEFVNDAGLPLPVVSNCYSRILKDFSSVGKEWVILTPHYVRRDWMGLSSMKDCDRDPRGFVGFLRDFAVANGVGLADASWRWGHLWREGLPYETLLVNNINHPNQVGMSFFADALMAIFEPSDVALSSREEFQIRDPFVLAENGTYYLYKTLVTTNGCGVGVATSKDLERWTEFAPAMVPAKGSRHTAVWAPEVHKYAGAYWLFTTLTFPADAAHPLVADCEKGFKGAEVYPRGVWVYRSETPTGPFRPVRDGSVTPADWMCLDGTLVVEDGRPWMVFCHEWCQVGNGRMMAAPLSDDLSRFTAKPIELFRAACRPGFGFVTDGPFLLRDGGTLRMIWSNLIGEDYSVIQCRSQSGRLAGPWVDQKVLYPKDGGHGMLFRRFDGQLMLTLHQPNVSPKERMRLYAVELTADGLVLK